MLFLSINLSTITLLNQNVFLLYIDIDLYYIHNIFHKYLTQHAGEQIS